MLPDAHRRPIGPRRPPRWSSRAGTASAPYGWFAGTIEAPGATLVVDGLFGVGEQQLIRA